jgi:DNA polymerase-3 subunit alpha/error-prone DNA polymerase
MRGTMSPAEICQLARKRGYRGVAITDRDNLYGLWAFLAACRREGLKPVVGSEVSDPLNGMVVTCLVQNDAGYGNLCTLLTKRHTEKDFNLQESLGHHGEGLFVLAAEKDILLSLLQSSAFPVADLGAGPTEKGRLLRDWARETGIPAVATPDCSTARPSDVSLYILLRAIAGGSSISDAVLQEKKAACNWFAAPDYYRERFSMWPEVITESCRIAEQCHFRGPAFGLVMPPWKGGDSAAQTLRRWAYRGAEKRYGTDLSEAVVERLEHELTVIDTMGFSSYFLVVRNIVHPVGKDGRRKKRRICGRGSGAASLVAYCLEITNVCPLKYNLYFERFLNPGRSDPPDIDIDFAWDERDEVLAEVLRCNKGYAAMVCNHVFFQPRMAIRETAKAYGLPGYEISRLTERLPWLGQGGMSLLEWVKCMPTMRGVNLHGPWPEIIELAGRLVGLPRHLSVHPGGVVITPKPISTYVPVEKAPKGVPIIQWEKDGAEEAGLVKIDLLGNRSLGVIRDCITAVQSREIFFAEESWEPEDDALTKRTVACGATMGCFYIESPAMRLLQQKAGSGEYEQLVIQSSIIRPAANEFVREYVRRLHGGLWKPLHPFLADVLDETFGLMVYQEDVSRVAVHLAGLSHARADGLRKVMSKKDKEHRLADYREEFFQGCLSRNIAETDIEAIWTMMMSFDGYSFCKPHSASYARVSFQAAYLKTYFPAEFMAAVIANQGGYYSTFAYVSEAKRCGVKILRPDVNESLSGWRGHKNMIRVGFAAIHGISLNLIERICLSRERHGRFTSASDFFNRVRPAEDEARMLIYCGALDSLEKEANRTLLLWEFASFRRVQASAKSMPLFGLRLPSPPVLSPPSIEEKLRKEYQALGFLCDYHPVMLLKNKVDTGGVSSRNIARYTNKRISFLGWLLTGKLVSTKTGEAMEFLTFEDEYGIVETTFFPRVYQQYASILCSGRPYLLYGLVEEDYGAVTLTVEGVVKIQPGSIMNIGDIAKVLGEKTD